MENVQPYKDLETMPTKDKIEYLHKPYTTKHGIIMMPSFTDDGADITDLLCSYLRKRLESETSL